MWSDSGLHYKKDDSLIHAIDRIDNGSNGCRKLQESSKKAYLQTGQPSSNEWHTHSQDIQLYRYGMQYIPWQQLRQYELYLKGFYFHSRGRND